MAVRIGFFGSGGIARAHMQALAQIEGAEMVAFCDVAADRAQACADQYHGRAYSDLGAMLDAEKLDALYVCTPPHVHGEPEIHAAGRGLHLFIEKPIANNLDTANKVLAAIEKAGVLNLVGYHMRYLDTVDQAKELAAGQTLGMVLGYWMGGMPGVPWWRVQAESGGQLVEQTTHIFDLARYFAGEVTHVCAATAVRALQDVPNFTVTDVGTVVLKFAGGAVGSISNTCLLSVPYTVGLHLIYPKMVLEIAGGLRVLEPGVTREIRSQVDVRRVQNEAFVKAIQSGKKALIRSDYADARRSLAVSLAANESAATGQAVAVPK